MKNLISQTDSLLQHYGYHNDDSSSSHETWYEIQESPNSLVLRIAYWEALPEEIEDQVCALGYTKFSDWDDDCGPIIMYLAN